MNRATAVPLKTLTYMKTGGPADEVITVTTTPELIEAVTECRTLDKRFIVIGGGSNTLFTDAGFRGTVIVNRSQAVNVDTQTHTVTADAGCPMNFLVNQVTPHGLSGIECYLGLPGTLGGAIYNNSHFKDHLIGEVIHTVTVIDPDNHILHLPVSELELAYDYSRFQHTPEVILSAVLTLTPDDPAAVTKRAQEALKFRSTHQPLSMPSSGSFFKNPVNAAPAGALIDQAGLKNSCIGGALVSPMHANFIVNTGTATTADIKALAEKVVAVVADTHGIHLEKEVFFINEFGERT